MKYLSAENLNSRSSSWKSLSWSEKRLHDLFTSRIRRGLLEVEFYNGAQASYGNVQDPNAEPKAQLKFLHKRAARHLLLHGEVAFAQSYMKREWESENLTKLFLLVIENAKELKTITAPSLLLHSFWKTVHFFRRNTMRGAKGNIEYHYDLGNMFYKKWLDKSMTYSSALFLSKEDDLDKAQHNKLISATKLAKIKRGDKVLEIGCGWGSFAELITKELSCHLHGISLSQRQIDFANDRIKNKRLEDKAKLELLDYRKLTGIYDAIVSIEMFEAVGKEYWTTYMQNVRDRLRPNGRAVLQIITVASNHFSEYQRHVDFVQSHIFPGGYLPSVQKLKELIHENGMKLEQVRFFGPAYAKTLAEWRKRFIKAWPTLKDQGFDERFRLMWTYYLSYCEAGFLGQRTDVGQYVIKRS